MHPPPTAPPKIGSVGFSSPNSLTLSMSVGLLCRKGLAVASADRPRYRAKHLEQPSPRRTMTTGLRLEVVRVLSSAEPVAGSPPADLGASPGVGALWAWAALGLALVGAAAGFLHRDAIVAAVTTWI